MSQPPKPETDGQNEAPIRSTRLFTGVFIAIICATLCCFVTGQGINSGTSVYINRLGGSATLAGIGAAVFSFAAILGRLAAGAWADTRGRLAVIVPGMAILLIGTLGSAFSANLDLIMLWRALQGLGFSAATTATATAAADVLPAERLGEGIGYYGLGQAVAMSIGPALAIALVSTEPPENLYWGLSATTALGLALCVFCRYERKPQILPETATYRRLAMQKAAKAQEATGQAKQKRTVRSIVSAFVEPGALAGGIPLMVLSPAFGFGIFFVGLFGTKLGIGNAGLFYTISALAMIAVRVSSGAFMDRVLPIKIFGVAVGAGLVCYAMLFGVAIGAVTGFAQTAVFYSAGLFYGLCLGLALPVNQAVAVKNSPAERWGAANGLFMLLFDFGIGLASALWGFTNDHMGFWFTILCVMALAVISFAVALFAYPESCKRRCADDAKGVR